MKQIVLITSALLFSILFYEQGLGLNMSIFTLLTIIVLSILNVKEAKKKGTLIYASLYLLSGIIIFINHTVLSYFTNFSLMCLYVGSISEDKSSIYIKWFNGISSIIAGFFYRRSEKAPKESSIKTKKEIDALHWLKLIGIPLALLVLFVILYSKGNPVFGEVINDIYLQFKFIEFKFILYGLIGYAIILNFSTPIRIKPATGEDLKTNNNLERNNHINNEILKKDTQLGATILGLLNVLLIGYLITEFLFITKLSNLSAQELSTQLHGGIYTLIISIIIAIITVLVLFKGNLNFYKNNKTVKKLAYSWLFLNAILVSLIVIKNAVYVNQFGITYKRIGVFVYLLLTLVGLLTSVSKVKNLKNLWFMLRTNINVAFIILFLCTMINWDRTITKYNLEHINHPDVEYLIGLSSNNADILYEYNKTHKTSNELTRDIEKKYNDLINQSYYNNWQEMSLINYKFLKN